MEKKLDWLVTHYGEFFESFGIDSTALRLHFEEWKIKSGETAVADYLWYLFHVLLGETRKQVSNPADYHRNLHEIYVKMLSFRLDVEGQKDNALVQLIIKNKILQWQYELSYPFRLQAISLNCCAHCEKINGQVFDAERVLADPYFAEPSCTRENGCSCGYIPVAATEGSRN